MARETFQPEGMARPKPPYSPAVASGDTVWTAGQLGHGPDGTLVAGGIAEQARRALENVRMCLAAAGCTLDDVVKVNTYLADLGDMAGYNEVYREVFTEPYPARTSVGVALPPGALIEIEAVARRS